MNATANNTASPFALRPDLKVMPMGGREPHFVIEDPLRGSFFRLGVAEYDALRQLTQLRGSAEILESSNARFGAEALTESRLRELLTWARQAGLLRESEKTPSGEAEIRGDAGLRIASPLFMRVSLGAPGPWVERIHAAGAWLFSRQIVFLWLTVMAWVGVQAWTNFPELIASWDNLASPSRALGAVVLWLVIKVLHEMGHAIACRRAGGEVRDAGFSLILFAPIAFVDVTSAWRFRSRWARIVTSLGGVYVESWICAGAMLTWLSSDAAIVRQLAADTVFVTTVSTLLFNLNPLMKFDGYYVLTDWLELPNLATQGQRQLTYLAQRWVLGARVAQPLAAARNRRLTMLYGVMAFVWQLLVTFSLLAAACLLLHGLGVVLAMVATVGLLRGWIRGWRAIWMGAAQANGFRPGLGLVRLAFLVALAIVSCFQIPLRPATTVSGYAHYSPPLSVRPVVDGFVRRVHVDEGDHVRAGDTLLELDNDEVRLELLSARVELATAEAQLEAARGAGDALALRLAEADVAGCQRRFAEAERRRDGLMIVAPADGVVIGQQLRDLVGDYVVEGEELAVVGRESQKALTVLVPQSSRGDSRAWAGRELTYRTLPSAGRTAICTSVEPHARTALPHRTLAASAGGPLEVRLDEKGEEVLTEPYFALRVPLEPTAARELFDGQRVSVTLTEHGPTLWELVRERWNSFRDRWDRR